MRNLLIILLIYIFYIPAIYAGDMIYKSIPDAQKIGEGRLSFLVWDVYDATFYAPSAKWQQNKPFALSLHYLISLKGKDIAHRSIEEMQKQGFKDEEKLAKWKEQMIEIFPDVQKGSELTAIFKPGKSTDFYYGDRFIATINDADFSKHFADIWLGEKTSEPLLRKKLLGIK